MLDSRSGPGLGRMRAGRTASEIRDARSVDRDRDQFGLACAGRIQSKPDKRAADHVGQAQGCGYQHGDVSGPV